MGLFLMSFALYANEKLHPRIVKTAIADESESRSSATDVPEPSNRPVTENVSNESPAHGADAKLQTLFQSFLKDSLFSGRTDGVRLAREPKAILIQFYGEDVFADGEAAMRESWYTALDRIAEKLTPEEFKKGLRIEVRGYADEASQKEQKPSDFGRSDFAFSFARAEWLARYLERMWRIPLQENFTLKGMGARPYGKKVELWLTY